MQCITVPIQDDQIVEDEEEIVLSVSPPMTLLMEPDSDTNVTIEVLDDDSMCVCICMCVCVYITLVHMHIHDLSGPLSK